MTSSEFYALGTPNKRTAFHVAPCDPTLDELRLFLGEQAPAKPVEFRQVECASGSTVGDLISTSAIPLVLLSQRAMSVFGEFSGCSSFPADVKDLRGNTVRGYRGLVVKGRCGPIDDALSEARDCPPPVPGGRRTRGWFGLYFKQMDWDRSDIFVPETSALTVVVERVKLACVAAKLTNIEFRPLSELENTRLPREML